MGDADTAVSSFNDSGLANFFALQFGVVGLLIPVAMFWKMRKNMTNVLFFLLLITTKLSYMDPLLFLGLLPLLMALPDPEASYGQARERVPAAYGNPPAAESPSS
jgi:hypothetical protein